MNGDNRILQKQDKELGWAYFCPHCKIFQCSGHGRCDKCGGKIDWKNPKRYAGRVKWT